MPYEDAEFKYEGWVGSNGKLEILFTDVNSSGANYSGVIRIQAINSNYYYVTQDNLPRSAREDITLQDSDVNKVIKYYNQGLHDYVTTIYLYETYRVEYDKNGATGSDIPEGWKWHGIDYLLVTNNLTKVVDGQEWIANGWNTTASGAGNNYSNGSFYYKENISQKFYAKFFQPGSSFYTIEWEITNPSGTVTFAIARDNGQWFNIKGLDNLTRDRGILMAEGDLITLPWVDVDESGKSLSQIFNSHILGWFDENGVEYHLGMTVERNMVFKAKLNGTTSNALQCKFLDDEFNEVHDSGLVANGASAYMALSGMDSATINNYQDGYRQWIAQNGDGYLRAADATGNVLTYSLGTKKVVVPPASEEQKRVSQNDFLVMFVILLLGTICTIGSVSVYILMRKKHGKINLNRFKEEKTNHHMV